MTPNDVKWRTGNGIDVSFHISRWLRCLESRVLRVQSQCKRGWGGGKQVICDFIQHKSQPISRPQITPHVPNTKSLVNQGDDSR